MYPSLLGSHRHDSDDPTPLTGYSAGSDKLLCSGLMGIAESLSDTSSADAAKDVDLGEGLELLMEAAEKGDGATQVMLDALLSNIAMLRAERAKRAEEEEKRSIKATADEVSELTL